MSEIERTRNNFPDIKEFGFDQDFKYLQPSLQGTFGLSGLNKLVSDIHYRSNEEANEISSDASLPRSIIIDQSQLNTEANEIYMPSRWEQWEKQRAHKVGVVVAEVARVFYERGMTDDQMDAVLGLKLDEEQFAEAVRTYATNAEYLEAHSPNTYSCLKENFPSIIYPNALQGGPIADFPK